MRRGHFVEVAEQLRPHVRAGQLLARQIGEGFGGQLIKRGRQLFIAMLQRASAALVILIDDGLFALLERAVILQHAGIFIVATRLLVLFVFLCADLFGALDLFTLHLGGGGQTPAVEQGDVVVILQVKGDLSIIVGDVGLQQCLFLPACLFRGVVLFIVEKLQLFLAEV